MQRHPTQRDDMDFHKRNDLRNRATEKTEDKKTIVRGKETKLKANIWRKKMSLLPP